jgi:phosphohistidine phosphatase
MRHAKSSWADESQDDHDRPLDQRGERAASLMGAFLAQSGLEIDLVLCSTATRSRQTALRLARLAALPEPIFERSLYLASASALLERLVRCPESASGVLLIGHNPGLADLAAILAGRGSADDLDQLTRKFPTAALAIFTTDSSGWAGLGPGSATLERFVRPKQLV